MKIFIVVISLILNACMAVKSSDPDSEFFSIPEGSTLTLNKKLSIPQGHTHAVIQHGKETTDNKRQDYEVNCRLDVKKFGPRTIEPETFRITRTEDGQNWISQPIILRHYTEIHLASDKNTDIIMMECQQYGDPVDYHFTVKEIETTLGNYFTFNFAPH